jgi:hypothetical protein
VPLLDVLNTVHALEAAQPHRACAGKFTLERARLAIATDWIAAFKRYVSADAKVEVLEPAE